jgi:hypothetical protein
VSLDLVADSVSVTPADPRPGDSVSISYVMRNAGTGETDSFTVNAYLTGGLAPSRSDPFIGTDVESGLEVGESRTGRIQGEIPADLIPGSYRIGILLDSSGDVSERDESNNGRSTDPLLTVERDAMETGPGQIVTGHLGPLGRDRFDVDLAEGSVLKLEASQDPGSIRMVLRSGASGTEYADTGLKRKAKAKLRVPADGTYEVSLESGSATFTDYELDVSAKMKKAKGETAVDGEARIPFCVYRGCVVKILVRGRKGFAPEAVIEELEAPVKSKKSKVKLGPVDAPANRWLTLVVRSADGEPGRAKYRISVKEAKEPLRIAR